MLPGPSPALQPPRVLYLVYWGLDEPLGSSLVVPAVRKLATRGVQYTVVSFEKPPTSGSPATRRQIRESLAEAGVTWIPLQYHKSPKWPATAFDLFQGAVRGALAGRRMRARIVHARTFVGGLMGYLAARLMGARFVFHNEGFYPDEQVDGGVWRRESWPHRVARSLERGLYERADGLIVLSRPAKAQVEQLPGVARRKTPVIVVRSCVDLDLFPRREKAPWRPGEPLRFVWLASVGGRYRFDEGVRLLEYSVDVGTAVNLLVLNQSAQHETASVLRNSRLSPTIWVVEAHPFSAIPRALGNCHVGLALYARGLSTHGCSPTKIGEYWASGLPVVIPPGLSDLEQILLEYRAGAILQSYTAESRARTLREILQLVADPDTPRRCREAAERLYALGPAVGEIEDLYGLVVGRSSQG